MIHILFVLLFISVSNLFSQTDYDLIIKKGIKAYENGDLNKAINIFQDGIIKEPENDLAIYELALVFMAKKDYKMAITYSELAIKLNGPSQLVSYNLLGSAINMIDEEKEAINIFKTAIDKYGFDHELCYNLALVHFKYKDYDDAIDILIESLTINPTHPSSHLLLGECCVLEKDFDEAILAFYYFLLLEQHTPRTVYALDNIVTIFTEIFNFLDNGNSISKKIYVNESLGQNNPANILMHLLQAAKNKKETAVINVSSKNVEFIKEQTIKLFNSNKIKIKRSKNIWNKFYKPFFNDLKNSEHLETFCYFICRSSSDEAITWLKNNPEKKESFINWLQGN